MYITRRLVREAIDALLLLSSMDNLHLVERTPCMTCRRYTDLEDGECLDGCRLVCAHCPAEWRGRRADGNRWFVSTGEWYVVCPACAVQCSDALTRSTHGAFL
jgi:hypothetical protein